MVNDLLKANQIILSQLQELLREMDKDQFYAAHEEASGASIGQHVRHVLEFYQCIVRAAQTGELNYDKRQRNTDLENCPAMAGQCIEEIAGNIGSLELDQTLTLEYNLVTETVNSEAHTNIERELLYALEHAIHHMAIIKMIVRIKYADVAISRDFGVAFSTIRHRNKLAADQ